MIKHSKLMQKTSEPVVNANDITRIAGGASIKGDLTSPTDIRIDGNIDGKVYSGGRVVVGETAKLSGALMCSNLDLWGKMFDSEGFARKIDTLQVQGKGTLTFVIAGSLGPSPAVVKRAELRWKLSDLTFPHQLTRLLVLEQVYRAHMILAHRPYHK